MRSEKWLWAPVAVLVVLSAALLASQSATASSSTGMAVDAIPGGVVDASVAVSSGATFDVDIVITDASTPYAGYQYELQWDPAVLAYDAATHLMPADLTVCSLPNPLGSAVSAGCVRSSESVSFIGPVEKVTMRCVADGASLLHLVTEAEDFDFGTTALAAGGSHIETTLADAQVICGAGGPLATPSAPTATPGGPAPTPSVPPPPGATPTPLPPGYEAVALSAACNPVTTTYADATPARSIAAAVGPAGNLQALWKFGGGVWMGYSPAYPQASDLTALDLLDVVFICVGGPGSFARPIV